MSFKMSRYGGWLDLTGHCDQPRAALAEAVGTATVKQRLAVRIVQ
jgi:hypothetical protein